MATVDPNPVVTKSWDVFVDAGDDFTLSLLHYGVDIEWRVTAANTAIETDIRGHRLRADEGLTRAVSGPGYVQLRMGPSQRGDGFPVALTTWSAG